MIPVAILDPCCGSRMMWFDRQHPAVIYGDRRAETIYERAARLTAATGERHEVDHVVPLRSSVVCGLHVPRNLEAIKAYKNRAKSNRFKVS